MGKKKIVLMSCDRNYFELEESVAKEYCGTLKNIIEAGFNESVIPLLNVRGRILGKVIEYCKCHQAAPRPRPKTVAQNMDEFDAKFVDVDEETLLALMLAAHYLDVSGLLHLTCKQTADMIKGKTTEEIRKSFNILNDFTPQEQEEVCRETAWAFL